MTPHYGELFTQQARNGDRIAVVRVPPTTSHSTGRHPAVLIVTINGRRVSEHRTEAGARQAATALLAARAHGH